MSEKLVIRGKRDESKHEGMASTVRREQEATAQINAYLDGDDVIPRNQRNHQDNLSRLHGEFYKGSYFHFGVPQPHSKE